MKHEFWVRYLRLSSASSSLWRWWRPSWGLHVATRVRVAVYRSRTTLLDLQSRDSKDGTWNSARQSRGYLWFFLCFFLFPNCCHVRMSGSRAFLDPEHGMSFKQGRMSDIKDRHPGLYNKDITSGWILIYETSRFIPLAVGYCWDLSEKRVSKASCDSTHSCNLGM